LSFDTWLAAQDANVRGLLDGHTKGLKNALDSERESRKGLEKQLKDLAGKAEKGSELEKQLNDLLTQQQTAQTRAEFYEAAHAAGVSNLKLAYVVASQEGLIDQKGRVNFDEMKKQFPELFGASQKPAPGNAGTGTNNQLSDRTSMDEFIRRKVNR
jgi:TolA-binding protein